MISKFNLPSGRVRKLCAIASVLAIFPAMLRAQTNSNPYGFEDNITTNWTTSGPTETLTANTNAAFVRTGGYSGKFTTTSTSSNKLAYTNTPFGIAAPGTYVHFIYWALGTDATTVVDASMKYAATNPPAGAGNTANSSSTTALNAATWTRLSYNAGNTSNRNYFPSPRRTSGNATTFYMDDMIIYTASSNITDTVKPGAPTLLTALLAPAGSGNVGLSWTSNTDPGATATGVQATMVLRSSNPLATAPSLNDQAKYSATGGSDGTMTFGDWTVISNSTSSTATSYTDNGPTSGTYVYAVALRDLAYNYSVAAMSLPVIVGSPLAITIKDFKAANKGGYNQVSWQIAAAASNDRLYLEKSVDGKSYTSVKEFATDSGETLFDDHEIAPKTYYRLKLMSNNDVISYSNTLSIMAATSRTLQVSPNPTENKLSFNFDKKESGNLVIRDAKGNVVLSVSFMDQDNLMLDIHELAAGYYVANVVGGNASYHAGFVKK